MVRSHTAITKVTVGVRTYYILRQYNKRPSLSVATVSLVQQVIIELSHTIIADTFIAEQQMVWLHVYRKA